MSNSFPSATALANILYDFDDSNENEEGNSSYNKSDSEADNEEEEDDDDSSMEDEMTHNLKPGERYTEFNFQFLKMEWLQPANGSTGMVSTSD